MPVIFLVKSFTSLSFLNDIVGFSLTGFRYNYSYFSFNFPCIVGNYVYDKYKYITVIDYYHGFVGYTFIHYILLLFFIHLSHCDYT